MLARLTEAIGAEAAQGRALGAFTCYDVSTALGVLDAAERWERPVALLLSERSLMNPHADQLTAALLGAAGRSKVSVSVQADHLRTIDQVRRAFEFGVQAVMIDGSRLPFEENLGLAHQAADVAREFRGDVEAELGRISGDEDMSSRVAAGLMTDPAQAARFTEAVDVACLAISIGNVHGEYQKTPALDWPRLQVIAEVCNAPLSLHGASGLPQSDLRRAIAEGARKFNVNTDLRIAIFNTLSSNLKRLITGYRFADLDDAVIKAVAEVVGSKLSDFDPTAAEHP